MTDKHLQKLRFAREKMPNYCEVLELAEKILVEKGRVKAGGTFPPFRIDPNRARIQLGGGFPYVMPGEIPLDVGQTREYFNRLLGILKEQNPVGYETLGRVSGANGFAFEPFLKRLLANELTENHFGGEWGNEGSLLFFFLVQSIKPTFEYHGESWQKEHKEILFPHGFCPFCGGLPGMGEIAAEGRRVLHCPLCATEWEFPRLRCPYCQNEDQEELTYFEVEGEPGGRVNICRRCQHYLKTVDSREKERPLDWEVEDYLTLHLDHLAQEEGYKRPAGLFVEGR